MTGVLMVLVSLLGICSTDKEHIGHAPHPPITQSHYFEDGQHNVEYDHEAVLGSKSLEEEFAKLSPEDAKKQLGNLVDKMDTNKNGFISREELIVWVLNSFRSLDTEEALEQMKEHDKDGNGLVAWEEVLDKVYGYLPEEIADFESDENPQVKALGEIIQLDKEKFHAADLNMDGVLGEDEYPAFMHPYDFQHMHETEVKRILQMYDKNNDGTIEIQEYLKTDDFPHDYTEEQAETDKDNFDAFDQDANGKLDKNEIRVWAIPDQKEAAEDEADHLIEESDSNKDGNLSKNEILEAHELWVGSSVLDYGKHIHGEL